MLVVDDEAMPVVIVSGEAGRERNDYAGICGPSITLRSQLTRRLAVASGRLTCAAQVVRQTALAARRQAGFS